MRGNGGGDGAVATDWNLYIRLGDKLNFFSFSYAVVNAIAVAVVVVVVFVVVVAAACCLL